MTNIKPPVSSRFVDTLGGVLRSIPSLPGKRTIVRNFVRPFIHGRGYEVAVPLKHNPDLQLICALDDWIPWNVFVHGHYSREMHCQDAMLSRLSPGAVVFDIGANIGYYTIQFAEAAGADGQVHAFEPVESTHRILDRNVAINSLESVVTNRCIVSSDLSDKRIHISEDATGNCAVDIEGAEFETVASTTLMTYCAEHNIDHIDLVKIDVEGHELHVLRGMSDLLAANRVENLFLEMNSDALSHAGTSNAEVTEFLRSFGYRATSICTGRESEYSPENDESLVWFASDAVSAARAA